MKRKKLIAVVLASAFALTAAAPASADKPKFNPQRECLSGAERPEELSRRAALT